MSGDTIVLRIQDKMCSDNTGKDTVMYILYDHELQTFLIRGKCISKNIEIGISEFSYYCDDKDQVNNMLNVIYRDFMKLTISLRNYNNLPKDSDKITYDLLCDTEERYILAIYDHTLLDKPTLSDYDKYLNILMSLYNNWM